MPAKIRSIPRIALAIAVAAVMAGCVINPVSYNEALPKIPANLFEYPYFKDQATGIAVSHQGRIFVTFPRWDKDPLYSVAEVKSGGEVVPFPGNDWNRWGKDEAGHPEAHFVCVQSATVDAGGDFLWVLDPASPGFKGVVRGGAKLVKIDLRSNVVAQVIRFDDAVAPPKSYLNDVRIDPHDPVAYITDSGMGAIVVVDLATGKSRRALADDRSTKAEKGYVPVIGGKELRNEAGQVPQIHADGLAIDTEGEYLYYHALTARSLYRIRTSFLKNAALSGSELAGHVERIADTGAVDGMEMDSSNNLYITALEENAIKRYRPLGGTVDTVVHDDRIQWPDSIAISPDKSLYFTASQIHRMPRFNYGTDRRVLPYKLFKIGLAP